jgi:hypothetical protein
VLLTGPQLPLNVSWNFKFRVKVAVGALEEEDGATMLVDDEEATCEKRQFAVALVEVVCYFE